MSDPAFIHSPIILTRYLKNIMTVYSGSELEIHEIFNKFIL